MKTYRVSFYNDLPNSYGHTIRCCQFAVENQPAENEDEAIEAAKKKFEAHDRIRHWSQHAHSFVVEVVLTSPSLEITAADEENKPRGTRHGESA